ncbi:hypothetical protein E2C01_053863 [Portunus trituberculatus]|uniref:Uncharacterized protein n=1 Tax=Portunus trituberculatus TaxID=210409 RepID=A0A5B7GR71_PORTR|nr:hypothetical protein [Portunus trituberculatus]
MWACGRAFIYIPSGDI